MILIQFPDRETEIKGLAVLMSRFSGKVQCGRKARTISWIASAVLLGIANLHPSSPMNPPACRGHPPALAPRRQSPTTVNQIACSGHFTSRTRSTAQQPRTCGPGPRPDGSRDHKEKGTDPEPNYMIKLNLVRGLSPFLCRRETG